MNDLIAQATSRTDALEATKARLLGVAVDWGHEERALAGSIRSAHEKLAEDCYRACVARARSGDASDDSVALAMAVAFFHAGEALKWAAGIPNRGATDFGAMNTLMRLALSMGHDRRTVSLPLRAGTPVTPEALYFRALLFARFAGGVLNVRQAEILDAWIWEWLSVLRGTKELPAVAALGVDLESREGLRRGRRPGPGPSLYLPPHPIAAAYRAILARMQAGRMVPETGIASTLRIEEHIAVLDLVSHGLRDALRPAAPRAERIACGVEAELFVGLAEVQGRALDPAAPPPARIALAASEGHRTTERRERERDNGIDSVYEIERCMVEVVDESATGFGLEGDAGRCAAVAKGDIVALRLSPQRPFELGKVERCAPSGRPGRVVIGVRKLSAAARRVALSSGGRRGAARRTAIFVPGEDRGGRQDAWLVSESGFDVRSEFEACVGERIYRLRLNRVRERGRGWVLAGFEVLEARLEREILIA